MKTLDQIGVQHGTDKSSIDHGYLDTYERYFADLRHQPVKLLELGVYRGASLRTWSEYFAHCDSDICGIDANIEVSQVGTADDPRLRLYRGDQTEVPLALMGWRPDVVIDDASHISSKTIASFIRWFPRLTSGGLYIVEDLVTSYYLGGPQESSPDPNGKVTNHYGLTAMQFLRELADGVVGCPDVPVNWDIEWITFHSNMCVVKRA